MSLYFKIAFKYIFAERKINFITIIIFISIISIAIGVAALIVVLSIFNGFRQISEMQLLSVDPNIRIIPSNSAYINNIDTKNIIKKLDRIPEIKSYSPAISSKAAIYKSNSIHIVETIAYFNSKYLEDFYNKFYKYGDIENENNIFIGYGLASRLSVHKNDTVNLLSANTLEKSIQTMQIPNALQMKVSSIFSLNVKDYDLTLAYIHPKAAKRLLKIQNNKDIISYIDIKLFNNDKTKTIANKIQSLLNKEVTILTWTDINSELYYVMQFERVAVFSILSLILLIAVFNIFASLAMTVVKKRSDIAILKSMGATDKMIQNIYISEGIIIGIFGTIAGLLLAIILIYTQNRFGWLKINGDKYIIDKIPMVINYIETTIVCIVSLGLSIIATIFPARKAAKAKIITSIKAE